MKKSSNTKYALLTDAQRRKMVRFLIESGQQTEFAFCQDSPQPSPPTGGAKPSARKRKRVAEVYCD